MHPHQQRPRSNRRLPILVASLLTIAACETSPTTDSDAHTAAPEPTTAVTVADATTNTSVEAPALGTAGQTNHETDRSASPATVAVSTTSTTSRTEPTRDNRPRHAITPQSAAIPPGPIAFTTEDEIHVWSNGEAHFFAKRPPARLERPRWSPDGTRLAYIAGGLIVVRSWPHGDPVSEVEVDDQIIEFRWSPSGDQLAFALPVTECIWAFCTVKSNNGIWVADLADGSTRRVAIGGERPTWDPTGERIAYLLGPDLRIVSASGGDSVLIHRFEDRSVYDLEWGIASWIAAIIGAPYGAPDGRGTRLGLVPVRDTEVAENDFVMWDQPFNGLAANIAWGPDGKALAVATQDGPFVTASIDDPLVPVGVDGETQAVSWSPDGRWLAFDSDRITFITPSTGGDVSSLGQGNQPHWHPG